MKIPIQQKIAELEQRISALEKQVRMRPVSTECETTTVIRSGNSGVFGDSWNSMWKSFNEVMRKI